jgi:selenocysteine-specific elongation factor
LLERETATWFKNKFIIRNYSPEYLIGGGEILNPAPVRHKKKDDKALQSLKIRESNDMETIIMEEIKSTNWKIEDLRKTLFSPDNEFDNTLKQMIDSNKIKIMSKYIVDKTMFENIRKKAVETMETFYKTSPGIKIGMHKEELRKKLQIEQGLFDLFIDEMKEFEIVKDRIKLTSWKTLLSEAQLKELQKVEELSRSELCAFSQFDREIIKILEGEGKIVNIKNEFFMHKDFFEKWKQAVKDYIEKNKKISIIDIKGVLGVTRKSAVAFAEYLDEINVTKRVGDIRILL